MLVCGQIIQWPMQPQFVPTPSQETIHAPTFFDNEEYPKVVRRRVNEANGALTSYREVTNIRFSTSGPLRFRRLGAAPRWRNAGLRGWWGRAVESQERLAHMKRLNSLLRDFTRKMTVLGLRGFLVSSMVTIGLASCSHDPFDYSGL